MTCTIRGVLFLGLAVVAAQSAAAATFSVEQLAADGSNLYNTGPQVYGDDLDANFGGSNELVTVNGVSFELNTLSIAITGGDGSVGVIDGRNDFPGATQTSVDPAYFTNLDLKAVMDDIIFNGGSTVTLEFLGLVDGQEYTAQFMTWDAGTEGEAGNLTRETDIEFEGEIFNYTHIVVDDGASSDELLPVVVTVDFVASGTSAAFTFDGVGTNGSPILNAATLHTVPEPATLSLLGLATLALIRRRR